MSGARVPRTGGVILANAADKETLDKILKNDPFCSEDIADYEIIEFTPSKYQLDNF